MTHLIDGEFQSDKYPTCPRGKVPLSVKDPLAQDLLWQYAQRRREVDEEFSADLESALLSAGYKPECSAIARAISAAVEAEREACALLACAQCEPLMAYLIRARGKEGGR